MKSITVKNFAEVFPGFVRDLHDASYIAIDLEFTGIDQSTELDYLTSPETACREKLKAARMYSPMQLGISIFRGDALLGDTVASPLSLAAVGTAARNSATPRASAGYRETMIREAMTFSAVEPTAKCLESMLVEIARNGTVTMKDIELLQQLLRTAQQESDISKNCLYDRLFSFHAEDEVRKAIAIIERWKEHIESGARHLCARNYFCYLFPAVRDNDVDCNVILSAAAVAFLQKNKMDWNKWIGEGLPLLPLDDYAAARTVSQHLNATTLKNTVVDEALDSLRNWIDSLPNPKDKNKLLSQHPSIASLVRAGAVGDTISVDLPYFHQQEHAKLCELLLGLGLRKSGKVITKYVSVSNAGREAALASDPRFFGARVLEALVNATRRKKKPLIIHNGLSDLAFLCCAMRSEPPSFEKEFKLVVREMFPLFYDTRTLCCVPSLQHIPNVTGPLVKVYSMFKGQNDITIQVLLDSLVVCNGEDLSIQEHNAAFDAFATGSLFAFLQAELQKVQVDFRRLRCITPVYGSVFSVHFENDNVDCIVQNPLSPMYAVRRRSHVPLYIEDLRNIISAITRHLSVIYNPEVCFITVGTGVFPDSVVRTLEAQICNWCQRHGFACQRLDVVSRMNEYGIAPIS